MSTLSGKATGIVEWYLSKDDDVRVHRIEVQFTAPQAAENVKVLGKRTSHPLNPCFSPPNVSFNF